ncbi:hypothetical protein BDQ12DRAFT_144332 [Crucibulum laeve]|uniref:Uncharacterized protein n=1 Tax=Crucibulum laeve TaxID=68775 RepID=A0A5C3LZK6_9AGAR|nr:hypothetical protein BDQ12DRAFT_144332 [Crucibulum laeve]
MRMFSYSSPVLYTTTTMKSTFQWLVISSWLFALSTAQITYTIEPISPSSDSSTTSGTHSLSIVRPSGIPHTATTDPFSSLPPPPSTTLSTPSDSVTPIGPITTGIPNSVSTASGVSSALSSSASAGVSSGVFSSVSAAISSALANSTASTTAAGNSGNSLEFGNKLFYLGAAFMGVTLGYELIL